jgi:predicted O-methyltransferase YrrM
MASSQPSPRPPSDPITRALAGWQPARVLMAANRLNIFTVLGDRYLSVREIAQGCGTHPRSTRLLLNACVALGYLHKVGARYGNSEQARELLVKGEPAYLGDAIGHADHLYVVWGHLAEAVRTNRRVTVSPAASDAPRVHRDFILAMHTRALRSGKALAESLDLTGRRQLFDAGGGPGTYSIFLVRRYPGLRAIIFDLPPTIEIAREVIAASGLEDRISVRPGNYFQDDFGQGNDVVLLSAVFHSMAPRKCLLLLRKSYDSLVSGGIVAVHEGLIDPDGTSPVGAALFSLNMLVNTGEGRSYSGREIAAWMREAGFVETTVKPVPPPANTGLVIGTKP